MIKPNFTVFDQAATFIFMGTQQEELIPLVEMMHYAVPIYAFDCAFNHATLDNLGVYFNSVEALTRILSNDLVASAGLPLLEVAQKKYTWEIVSKQYLSLFQD